MSDISSPLIPSRSGRIASYWKNLAFVTWASIRAHALFLGLTVGYVLGNIALVNLVEGTGPLNLFDIVFSFEAVIVNTLFTVIVIRFIHLAVYVRPDHPIPALYRDVKSYLSSPGRLANALPIMVAMAVFITCFGNIKLNIPVLNPFSWDLAFMEMDKWLHFGWHPWELLQPFLGYPLVSFIINLNYNLWLMVMWGVVVWQAFDDRNSRLRIQFFLSFFLSWIIGGSILATVFSSAGPVYYGELGLGANPYKPLMTYLYEADKVFPIWALDLQQLLWANYTKETFISSMGIAAMPSLHNATAAIMAILGFRANRTLGIILTIHAALIVVGSVHLGWHYAVDAYFGIALGLITWWVSGKIADWYRNFAWSRSYDEILTRLRQQAA